MEPKIVERVEQQYVGRRESVTMTELARVADHLPGMIAGLGVPMAGPPFFRYRVIDMSADLVVEAGVPTPERLDVAEPLFADSLPGGRYVTVTHIGHPDELVAVTGRMLDWAAAEGLTWDMQKTPSGEVWACRLELMLTNPAEQPDLHQWETVLMFKLAD